MSTMLKIIVVYLLIAPQLLYARTSLSLESGLSMLSNDSLSENGVKPIGLNYQLQYGLTSPFLEFGAYFSASNLSGKIIHDSIDGKISSKSNSLGAYMLMFKGPYHFELAVGKADFKREVSKEFSSSQQQAIYNIYDLESEQSSLEMRAGFGFFLYKASTTYIYTRFSASHYSSLNNNEFSARIGLKLLFK